MALELEILSPDDKPALIALNAPDYTEYSRGVLGQLGYKVHATETTDDFLRRFSQFQYHVVLIDENFGNTPGNPGLTTIQQMPMAQRRHATIILAGDTFETLNALQAFQQSVHAVVNRADFDKLQLIVQQVMNDNSVFLHVFRDVQANLAERKR
jgi:DNA-binding NtrC family response regulator